MTEQKILEAAKQTYATGVEAVCDGDGDGFTEACLLSAAWMATQRSPVNRGQFAEVLGLSHLFVLGCVDGWDNYPPLKDDSEYCRGHALGIVTRRRLKPQSVYSL